MAKITIVVSDIDVPEEAKEFSESAIHINVTSDRVFARLDEDTLTLAEKTVLKMIESVRQSDAIVIEDIEDQIHEC